MGPSSSSQKRMTAQVLMFPFTAESYVIPAFWDLVKIVESLAEKVHTLTTAGEKAKAFSSNKVVHHEFKPIIGRFYAPSDSLGKILNYLEHELQTLYHMYRLRKEISTILSFQSLSLLSLFLCQLTRRKSIVYIGGNPSEALFRSHSTFLKPLVHFSVLLWGVQARLADVVVAISPRIQHNFRIHRRIFYANVRLVNRKFDIVKPYRKRKSIVGYVGRLEEEKGVWELARALPLVRQEVNVDFLIVGDGSLLDQIRRDLSEKEVSLSVTFTGWVRNVHEYLNEMKLLVLPSKTEGFPSVVLEAMACGTPVLATPVGDIPFIIKDGFNGFVLESTQPASMSKKIIELLGKPELLFETARSASQWVRENYSCEQTIDQWQLIFNELNKACKS